MSVAPPVDASPLRRLVEAYNGIGQVLRSQRQDLYQRELRLFAVACARRVWHLLPVGCRSAVKAS